MQSLPLRDRAWLRPIPGRTGPAGARLFCFPYAGAGATVFRDWGPGLPDGVEALAVQLPGREDRFRERPVADLDELLDTLVPGLSPFLDRPFAVFGHSMGAIICWELCRRLRDERGIEPFRIFVSGCRALQFHASRTPGDAGLSDTELVDELVALNGTPQQLLDNPEFLSLVLPAFRADLSLFAGYVHRPSAPLTCPVTVFGGSEDPRVAVDHLKGWADLTTGPCDVQVFPGGHFFLTDQRAEVLQNMSRALAERGVR
ncbi:alpha/beta fold hydrolase [Streptomyces sp. S.PNR 29]|uniref:thioesterase II family protein n=1 Tax=Streptomyces sp. S.PNR 29 TaxID=2973805 RepID=UPI0025B075E6|nr:alpha/beta fold hydrolase [Streptomyces sp. S.PNR 29]MDN0197610.1 alpha/beta fold hydrolase [Streptomyces sp. S.PNR 29]